MPSIGRAKATQSPFAAWLERAMLERGLPGPSTAGEAIGIPQSQISRYLNDRVKPSRSSVAKLARWAGVDEQAIWALIPEEKPIGGGLIPSSAPEELASRIARLEDAPPPPWAHEMLASLERLRAGQIALGVVHAGQVAPPRPAAEDAARLEAEELALLEAAGHRGLVRVDVLTEDLLVHRRRIPPGATLWVHPTDPAEPGGIVRVEVAGRLYLRVVGPDGHTLLSGAPDAVPLDLATVDRVVAVGRLVQITV